MNTYFKKIILKISMNLKYYIYIHRLHILYNLYQYMINNYHYIIMDEQNILSAI